METGEFLATMRTKPAALSGEPSPCSYGDAPSYPPSAIAACGKSRQNPFPSSHPPDIRGPSLVTEDEAWRPGGGDGVVDIIDFLSVLAEWGSGGPFDCDIDGNGIVGIGDLLHVLINWGACVDPS